jgi:hypothetical protein
VRGKWYSVNKGATTGEERKIADSRKQTTSIRWQPADINNGEHITDNI